MDTPQRNLISTECTSMPAGGSAREAVRLLEPLIGVRGQYGDRTLELVEVLVEGPQVAVLDTTSGPSIQTNQYGDPLTRQPRILTLPVFSEIEADAHPVLRALLPDTILAELRRLIEAPGDPPPEQGMV